MYVEISWSGLHVYIIIPSSNITTLAPPTIPNKISNGTRKIFDIMAVFLLY